MPIFLPFLENRVFVYTEHDERGFTLIELLVVLGIMSLAAILFVGVAGTPGSSARYELSKLKSEVVLMQQRAITSNITQELALADYGVNLKPQIGSSSAKLRFYSDGSTNGGTVLRGQKELFKLRWIDGQIVQ